MRCDACGAEESLPFVCTYCGRSYCSQHRLPENHSCPEYWKVRLPRAPSPPTTRPRPVAIPIYDSGFPYAGMRRSAFEFSSTEKKHILAGTALVAAAGISLIPGYLSAANVPVLAASTLFFTLGFILHELAHKFAARHYGMWAEFRLNLMGALLTLMSVVSPVFKIIAPGAVVIAGQATLSSIGLTALVGPLINLGLVLLLWPVSLLAPHSALAQAAFWGAYINSFMAVFNLLPIAILDGRKIFKWSKPVWAVVFLVAAAAALTLALGFSARS